MKNLDTTIQARIERADTVKLQRPVYGVLFYFEDKQGRKNRELNLSFDLEQALWCAENIEKIECLEHFRVEDVTEVICHYSTSTIDEICAASEPARVDVISQIRADVFNDEPARLCLTKLLCDVLDVPYSYFGDLMADLRVEE